MRRKLNTYNMYDVHITHHNKLQIRGLCNDVLCALCDKCYGLVGVTLEVDDTAIDDFDVLITARMVQVVLGDMFATIYIFGDLKKYTMIHIPKDMYLRIEL